MRINSAISFYTSIAIISIYKTTKLLNFFYIRLTNQFFKSKIEQRKHKKILYFDMRFQILLTAGRIIKTKNCQFGTICKNMTS